MKLNDAITELASHAGPRSFFIDMQFARHHRPRSAARDEVEWTVSVLGHEVEGIQQWSAPTLDEAMAMARTALRTVDVTELIGAADDAMKGA